MSVGATRAITYSKNFWRHPKHLTAIPPRRLLLFSFTGFGRWCSSLLIVTVVGSASKTIKHRFMSVGATRATTYSKNFWRHPKHLTAIPPRRLLLFSFTGFGRWCSSLLIVTVVGSASKTIQHRFMSVGATRATTYSKNFWRHPKH